MCRISPQCSFAEPATSASDELSTVSRPQLRTLVPFAEHLRMNLLSLRSARNSYGFQPMTTWCLELAKAPCLPNARFYSQSLAALSANLAERNRSLSPNTMSSVNATGSAIRML